MDHRCGARVPFVTDVVIRHLDKPELTCTTRDLSHDGICIVADERLVLPMHSVVEIELNLLGDDVHECHVVHAMLVYRETGCYGFLFTQIDSKARKAIDVYVATRKSQS